MSVAPRASSPTSTSRVRASQVPITVCLIASAIALSMAGWSSIGLEPFVANSRAFFAEPWRIATAQLVHVDVGHLFGNLLATWHLGRALEPRLGRPGFLALVGFLTLGLELGCRAFDRDGIGLSGIVYGLWAFLAVGGRRMPALRGLLSPIVHVYFVVWFFVCIALTAMGQWPISNWGHGLGALLGAIAALCIGPDLRWARRNVLVPAGVLVLFLVGATVLRERVNFGAGALAEVDDGDLASEREDWPTARDHYESALRIDPALAEAWFGLADVLHQSGDFPAAADAAVRAIELGLDDHLHRAYAAKALTLQSFAALEAGRLDEALETSLRATRMAPDDAEAWWYLAVAQDVRSEAEAAADSAFRACELGMADEDNRKWTLHTLMLRTAAEVEAGRYDHALVQAQRAAHVAPDVWAAWENVRLMAERVGDADEVRRAVAEQGRLALLR